MCSLLIFPKITKYINGSHSSEARSKDIYPEFRKVSCKYHRSYTPGWINTSSGDWSSDENCSCDIESDNQSSERSNSGVFMGYHSENCEHQRKGHHKLSSKGWSNPKSWKRFSKSYAFWKSKFQEHHTDKSSNNLRNNIKNCIFSRDFFIEPESKRYSWIDMTSWDRTEDVYQAYYNYTKTQRNSQKSETPIRDRVIHNRTCPEYE